MARRHLSASMSTDGGLCPPIDEVSYVTSCRTPSTRIHIVVDAVRGTF
jgi:hypothetical protein